MFSIKAEGNLLTFTALKCNSLQVEGTIGTTRVEFDTAFTLSGAISFTISPKLAGKYLRFRTHTKCGNNSNSSWIGFTLSTTTTLPVKVVHFSAHPNKSAVQIFYHVEVTEGDAFEIERSADGHQWQRLFSSVSTTQNNYTDKRSIVDFATTEKNFYRLKLWNGAKYSYSPVLYVPLQKDSVSLYNLNGVLLKTVKADRLLQELKQMPRGVYVTSEGIKLFN